MFLYHLCIIDVETAEEHWEVFDDYDYACFYINDNNLEHYVLVECEYPKYT